MPDRDGVITMLLITSCGNVVKKILSLYSVRAAIDASNNFSLEQESLECIRDKEKTNAEKIPTNLITDSYQ
jgi:hypothetical protein